MGCTGNGRQGVAAASAWLLLRGRALSNRALQAVQLASPTVTTDSSLHAHPSFLHPMGRLSASMVHIPILKVDVPDPDIASLLPAAATATLSALTALHDAVAGVLRPLPPAAAALYEGEAVAALPREVRAARKRIRARRIDDEDKQSSELEEAAFAYYRRMIRTNWVGYSDEASEDTALRRLTAPGLPGLQADARAAAATRAGDRRVGKAGQDAASAAMDGLAMPAASLQAESVCDQTVGAGTRPHAVHQPEAAAHAPGLVQRAVVPPVAAAAGLALGAGIVRLAALLSSLRRRGKAKPRSRSGKGAAHLPPRHARVSSSPAGQRPLSGHARTSAPP